MSAVRFDWRRFCSSHRIHFVSEGANTAAGNISIKCPFCGSADPSQHMGLSLSVSSPVWGCLRNSKHRGIHPAWLIRQLLGVSFDEAKRMVESETPPLDDFEGSIARLKAASIRRPGKSIFNEVMTTFTSFRSFDAAAPSHYMQRFIQYIAARGFGAEAVGIARDYSLWWAITGPQAYRVIFPVHDPETHNLIGWTGRDITGQSELRYKTAPGMGKDVIMAFPSIHEELRHLVLCEGPFDALKIDCYGAPHGVGAVAMMGTAITHNQVLQLLRLQRRVPTVHVLFDEDAVAQSLGLVALLEGFSGAVRFQPMAGHHDPGDMKAADVKEFCLRLK